MPVTCRDQGQFPPPDHPNSDALNVFMHFFVAEAQAKELATRKEAHAFKQRLHSERDRDQDYRHRPHGRDRKLERHHQREATHFASRRALSSLHRMLDNRPVHRHDLPRTQPHEVPLPQSPSMSITPPPSLPSPASPSPPAEPAGDLGADIDSLIAESEQMDLEAEARRRGFTTEELFGSVVLLGLVTIVNMSLLVLLAAMGTMNIESAPTSQA
ncbi:uncharacterized protein F5147DRAFT_777430 [Suillus discolor]|uniref:Uncharacterized protein n=1 Tax=Suillus discolor TaxID=1912936 RepID=A0A9P7JQI2_9AGAM|nr:uncharacterized protein F5147DRAFT_777430 [Suillus discolor]KAG2098913.1 hypothetical protein F5147DRAFT_777430 [Suillus discolor]